MKRFFLSIFVVAIFITFLFFGNFSEAATTTCPGTPCPPGQICFQNPLCAETFEDLINAIINFIFTIAIALAPLMVLIGAFYIMSAGGDPKRVETGKNIILYTVIGLVIVFLAKAIAFMIRQILAG